MIEINDVIVYVSVNLAEIECLGVSDEWVENEWVTETSKYFLIKSFRVRDLWCGVSYVSTDCVGVSVWLECGLIIIILLSS